MATADPYRVLGVSPSVSEAELRAAYRRLVQLHHPDHNGGSAEAARRFEEVQEAYARIRRLRATRPPTAPRAAGPADPKLEARLAEMERELAAAHAARARAAAEAARRAAREAAGSSRTSDEELGYVRTDDSLTKIFDDLIDELGAKLRRETD